ncbi:MAG: Hpt domain-containing protein [Steroidobacteraceae bacterium]
MAGIRTAVANGDAVTLKTIAHTLKSASFSIGAKQIGELCATLEAAGRAGEITGIESPCTELDRLFAALLPEIEQYL